MRSPRPVTTPRQSRSKARAALAAERTQAVAGQDCRINTGCVRPARCRAAGQCLGADVVVESGETRKPQ